MIKCIFVVANGLIIGDEYHGRNTEKTIVTKEI